MTVTLKSKSSGKYFLFIDKSKNKLTFSLYIGPNVMLNS